jgi:hypothetical protein
MEVDIAAAARLVAEPARALMLDALTSGQSLPAGELARAAGVSPITAGALDAVLCGRMLTLGWFARRVRGQRAVRLMGVELDDSPSPRDARNASNG